VAVVGLTPLDSVITAPGLLFDLRTGVFVQLKVHYTASSSGDAGRRCYAAARRGLDELRLHRVGALLLRGPSEDARRTGKLTDDDVGAWRAVWKSTSASGALGDDAAVLARSSGEEPAPPRHRGMRRWRGGRSDDSARTRRKILISTQVARAAAFVKGGPSGPARSVQLPPFTPGRTSTIGRA
jgi:hypothetical protein